MGSGLARLLGTAGLIAGVCAACAGPPHRSPGRIDPGSDATSTPTLVLMVGVVVDTIGSVGTLTVKDVQDHGTWTVAVGPGTRFYGIDGGTVRLDEIEIGQRVQIRGTSRVPSIVEADQIDIEKPPAPPAELPSLLPR